MPSLREIELTLRSRIKDIDKQVELLRAEQVGLEKALSIALGESELVGDYACDPLGKAILTVNNPKVAPAKNCRFRRISRARNHEKSI